MSNIMTVLFSLLFVTTSALAPLMQRQQHIGRGIQNRLTHRTSQSHLFSAGSSGMAGARSATAKGNDDTIGMPSPIDPLVNKLPWNARKVKARLARQVRRDVAELHRSLGIQEDAPYEDVVEAANRAIREAGSNVKARLMIERNKDRILDLRLKERLAGLTSVNMEARSQSTYEKEGAEIVKKKKKRVDEEDSGPKWMQGLVVKPDTKWRNRQLSTYGIMSLVGVLLPPVIDKMLMIQLLIVIGQLIWRGVPREDGGVNLFGNSDGGGSHKKVAWLLGASIFFAGKLLVFALMPNALRGSKWAEIGGFCAENVLYMTANMFLQPYKG